MVTFQPGATGTDEVLFDRRDRLGLILLNRPKAINALTFDMIEAMRHQLSAWENDDRVAVVSIQGAGDRGLCAGGDVRRIREGLLDGTTDPGEFWSAEYALNAHIADYPKPVVAIMDGVTMGGGVGIASHASIRLTTERSRIAMPETAIGFFPDVGGLYLLSRAPGELGTHMALTGAPVDGADAVLCGLADTVIDSGDIDEVIERLVAGEAPESLVSPQKPIADLATGRDWIDHCYRGDDPAAILTALASHDDPRARQTAKLIGTRSPLSVAVTLVALRRAAGMSLPEVFAQDLVLGKAFAARPDFSEGVRAVLVDKDHHPRWQHRDVSAVTDDEVAAMFA
ncbi:enoyl-CoA hydratase/isomerase family protein [Stackebrandtia endophytica]|uniref:enoyl-CoA hydratase/isomerase family protein n=1 Tax=Stackebrandtia endophytica TaxID=1496996 RepID=UPI00114ED91A|nr:enoyl-CoA hydratase/isomerase family protein [Stackebrandtia endophytica]